MPTTVKKIGEHNFAIIRHGKVVGHSHSESDAKASARIADSHEKNKAPKPAPMHKAPKIKGY
jgi:hypothetical protein